MNPLLSPYNLPSVQDGAEQIRKSLSQEDIDYIRKTNVGSPFSRLHDLCDANMLIPGATTLPTCDENQAVADAYTDYANAVIEAFNQLIRRAYTVNQEFIDLIDEACTALYQLEGYCAEEGIAEVIDIPKILEALHQWRNKGGTK